MAETRLRCTKWDILLGDCILCTSATTCNEQGIRLTTIYSKFIYSASYLVVTQTSGISNADWQSLESVYIRWAGHHHQAGTAVFRRSMRISLKGFVEFVVLHLPWLYFTSCAFSPSDPIAHSAILTSNMSASAISRIVTKKVYAVETPEVCL